MKLLAIPLSNPKTVAKWLVMPAIVLFIRGQSRSYAVSNPAFTA